jgi:YVTN family beta-propeller protein
MIYLANGDDNAVTVLRASNHQLIQTIPVGTEPSMIAVNPHIGASGHIFVTTTGEDGGWNRFLLLPKGWPEYLGASTARPLALDLNEPQEGIVFDPDRERVSATSRGDDLLAVYLDGERTCPSGAGCPSDSARLGEYQITVCVASPDGTCRQTLAQAGLRQRQIKPPSRRGGGGNWGNGLRALSVEPEQSAKTLMDKTQHTGEGGIHPPRSG